MTSPIGIPAILLFFLTAGMLFSQDRETQSSGKTQTARFNERMVLPVSSDIREVPEQSDEIRAKRSTLDYKVQGTARGPSTTDYILPPIEPIDDDTAKKIASSIDKKAILKKYGGDPPPWIIPASTEDLVWALSRARPLYPLSEFPDSFEQKKLENELYTGLRDNSAVLKTVAQSMGRIHLVLGRQTIWANGIILTPQKILTNNHVAVQMAEAIRGDGLAEFIWVDAAGNITKSKLIRSVATSSSYDVAVFLMGQLPIAPEFCLKGKLDSSHYMPKKSPPDAIALVGFPNPSPDYEEQFNNMKFVFGTSQQNVNIKFEKFFDPKADDLRIAPGKLYSQRIVFNRDDHQEIACVTHDCLTISGSSGSLLFSLTRKRPVGIHLGGVEGKANVATLFSELKDSSPINAELGLASASP